MSAVTAAGAGLGPTDEKQVAIFDVAIVGLGPVGAALACLLGQRGVCVLALEREGEPYALPRAVHFDDEVMRVFQAIGIASEMLPLTHVSPGMIFRDASGRTMLEWPRSSTVGLQGWHESYRFHQPDLEQVLRRRLGQMPSVTALTRKDVFAIDQGAEAVALSYEDLASGRLEAARARYVVGCDGARSLVRRLIGSEQKDLGFHERWLVVDCLLKLDKPELGDHSIQYCDPARPATYVRGVGRRRRWEITALAGETNAALVEPSTIWRLLSPWITPAEAEIERAAVYTFHSVVAERWRHGRMIIAGDAAHQTPPFLGQGLCAGIRDASNLAWKLEAVLRGTSGEALLQTYESERRPHVTEYIDLAVRLGGMINTRASEGVLPRPPSADEPPQMRSLRPRLGPGIGPDAASPVGWPAPQPRLLDGRMLDDVVGCRFALLALRAGDATNRELSLSCSEHGVALVFADETIDLGDWLESEGITAALVRPDRYIAAVARSNAELATLPALVAHLTTDIRRADAA
jgi:3-(3-hydroxy-phenyl)propionate hydroxylase